MNSSAVPDYITLGFEKIERDLQFLIASFSEVLCDLGHADLAAALPWTGKLIPEDVSKYPPQLGLVYSIAFQLLNLVEENAAGQMRVLREAHEGLSAEHGLWGRQLERL